MNKAQKSRLIFLTLYLLLALITVLIFKPLYIISIIMVFGIPSVVNFMWLKNSRWPIFCFSLISALLFAPPIELMARLLNVWDVQSIFYRPLGLIPVEDMLFAFLNFFWVLSFYKYFIDRDQILPFNKKFKYLIALYVIFSSLIFGLYFYDQTLVGASYFTIALISLIVPGFILFTKNPQLLKKTIIPTLFFAGLFFIYELISLQTKILFWPGDYWVNLHILGQTMPLDDIVIWYFLSTPVLIGGYEFFVDDNQ